MRRPRRASAFVRGRPARRAAGLLNARRRAGSRRARLEGLHTLRVGAQRGGVRGRVLSGAVGVGGKRIRHRAARGSVTRAVCLLPLLTWQSVGHGGTAHEERRARRARSAAVPPETKRRARRRRLTSAKTALSLARATGRRGTQRARGRRVPSTVRDARTFPASTQRRGRHVLLRDHRKRRSSGAVVRCVARWQRTLEPHTWVDSWTQARRRSHAVVLQRRAQHGPPRQATPLPHACAARSSDAAQVRGGAHHAATQRASAPAGPPRECPHLLAGTNALCLLACRDRKRFTARAHAHSERNWQHDNCPRTRDSVRPSPTLPTKQMSVSCRVPPGAAALMGRQN